MARQETFGFVVDAEGLDAPQTEAQKRDQVLDALARFRAEVIRHARAAAEELFARDGSVTAPRVLALMRERGHGPLLDSVDARCVGVVFRSGWTRVGWEPEGSHGRPVAVWGRS